MVIFIFFIAVTGAIIESSFITSHFFYYHYFKPILLVEIISPIIGIFLGSFEKPGKPKQIAIILNSLFFFSIAKFMDYYIWQIKMYTKKPKS
ncbi:hypothetical protein, partial [Bacillus pseudomycoides]